MDQPDHRLPRDHVGDRDTPQRKAPQEIVSAVNRINDPAPLPCLSSALLAEKAVRRKSLGETGANQGLDLAIGIADEILWSFGLARQVFAVGEMSGRELPGLQDQLSGESEAGFDRHGLGRPPDILQLHGVSAISHLKPWRAPSRGRCALRPSDASVPSSTAPASTG